MVAEGERLGLVEVGIGTPADRPRPEESFAAQRDVRLDGRVRDGRDLVVARHLKVAAAPLAEVRQTLELAAELAERGLRRRRVRPALLRGVVKRRQIEIGFVDVLHVRHRLEVVQALPPDLRGGERPPVAPEGERAAEPPQHGRVPRRLRVAAHDHAAAVLVDRRRREDEVEVFAERLLEEEHAERLARRAPRRPDARALHEARALLPEDGLPERLRPVAVRDHPVFGGRKPRAQGRLRDARHGREDARTRRERQPGKRRQAVALQKVPAQPGRDDVEPLHRPPPHAFDLLFLMRTL